MKIISYKIPSGKNTRIANVMTEGKQTSAGHSYGDGSQSMSITDYTITGEADGRAFEVTLTANEARSVVEAWKHGMSR
jgi:hypothetical protein